MQCWEFTTGSLIKSGKRWGWYFDICKAWMFPDQRKRKEHKSMSEWMTEVENILNNQGDGNRKAVISGTAKGSSETSFRVWAPERRSSMSAANCPLLVLVSPCLLTLHFLKSWHFWDHLARIFLSRLSIYNGFLFAPSLPCILLCREKGAISIEPVWSIRIQHWSASELEAKIEKEQAMGRGPFKRESRECEQGGS